MLPSWLTDFTYFNFCLFAGNFFVWFFSALMGLSPIILPVEKLHPNIVFVRKVKIFPLSICLIANMQIFIESQYFILPTLFVLWARYIFQWDMNHLVTMKESFRKILSLVSAYFCQNNSLSVQGSRIECLLVESGTFFANETWFLICVKLSYLRIFGTSPKLCVDERGSLKTLTKIGRGFSCGSEGTPN